MPSVKAKLTLPDSHGSHPFLRFDSYDVGFVNSSPLGGVGSNFPVELTNHHIIPNNILVTFWNKLVNNGVLRTSGSQLLIAFYKFVEDYADLNKSAEDLAQVANLVKEIKAGSITHDANALSPIGKDNLTELYSYLPGNIFIGPKPGVGIDYRRRDDPGSGFEVDAEGCIGNTAFSHLRATYNKLTHYIRTGGKKDGQRACNGLAIVARILNRYPLTRRPWRLHNKGYSL